MENENTILNFIINTHIFMPSKSEEIVRYYILYICDLKNKRNHVALSVLLYDATCKYHTENIAAAQNDLYQPRP